MSLKDLRATLQGQVEYARAASGDGQRDPLPAATRRSVAVLPVRPARRGKLEILLVSNEHPLGRAVHLTLASGKGGRGEPLGVMTNRVLADLGYHARLSHLMASDLSMSHTEDRISLVVVDELAVLPDAEHGETGATWIELGMALGMIGSEILDMTTIAALLMLKVELSWNAVIRRYLSLFWPIYLALAVALGAGLLALELTGSALVSLVAAGATAAVALVAQAGRFHRAWHGPLLQARKAQTGPATDPAEKDK
jgi:hypothetical protein